MQRPRFARPVTELAGTATTTARAAGPLIAAGLLLSAACGTPAAEGDCGAVLSSGECQIVRAQLGPLPRDIPADPTNSFSANADARLLGQALFFDTCLSEGQAMSCATCHQPGAAFADAVPRPLLQRVLVNGSPAQYLPPIENPTLERLGHDPMKTGDVRPQYDPQGFPLAFWNRERGAWEGVLRRGQTSPSANPAQAYTGRNTPTLYNIAYGAGSAPADRDRSYGVTWTPLDGRYDSMWALSGEVFEFAAVQRTNRAYLAQRIYRRAAMKDLYEKLFGAMPALDAMTPGPEMKRIYPLNASPATGYRPEWTACWNTDKCADGALDVPLKPPVKEHINQIMANAGKAVAAYIAGLRSNQSPYDRFVGYWSATGFVAGDPTALTAAQQRGLRLFIGKAECVLCHGGPNFTDWRFHNLGVSAWDGERRANGSNTPPAATGANPPPLLPAGCPPGAPPTPECPDQGRYAWQSRLSNTCIPGGACQNASTLSCAGSFNKPESDARSCLPKALFDSCALPQDVPADTASQRSACEQRPACAFVTGGPMNSISRCVPRAQDADLGAFKTPSLRNVGKTWPYMHNGTVADLSPEAQASPDPTPHLRKVVEFYNEGGGTPVVGTLDPLIHPLNLSSAEINDLVEFLKALTDDTVGDRPEEKAPMGVANAPCP